MLEIIAFLSTAFVFGVAAALSPGPLIVLIISETIQHGRIAGIKVALAPLLSAVPIIGISFPLYFFLTSIDFFAAAIAFIGALFLLYIAYNTMRIKEFGEVQSGSTAHPLRKGAIVNTFNPYPYLFWFSVGASIVAVAAQKNIFLAAGFVATYFISVVIFQVGVAYIVAYSRDFLRGRWYLLAMKTLGVLLFVFSALLFYRAYDLFVTFL